MLSYVINVIPLYVLTTHVFTIFSLYYYNNIRYVQNHSLELYIYVYFILIL